MQEEYTTPISGCSLENNQLWSGKSYSTSCQVASHQPAIDYFPITACHGLFYSLFIFCWRLTFCHRVSLGRFSCSITVECVDCLNFASATNHHVYLKTHTHKIRTVYTVHQSIMKKKTLTIFGCSSVTWLLCGHVKYWILSVDFKYDFSLST